MNAASVYTNTIIGQALIGTVLNSNITAEAEIQRLRVTGGFGWTNVKSPWIKSVILHNVASTPTQSIFTIEADRITSYTRFEAGKKVVGPASFDTPSTAADSVGDYRLVIT